MDLHFALLALGGLLLVGLLTDEIGRRTHLPRVTLLIVFGALAGPDAFDLLPKGLLDWYEFFASVALTMVAFLLGGTLSRVALREHGKTILVISVSVVCVTVIVVSAGLLAIGAPVVLALLLAGIATATAPAAIRDVVRQLDAKGSFSKVLLGIVAVDDAWGLIAFSLLLVAAKAISGDGSLYILGHGLWELGGSIAIGIVVGLPAAYLTGRLRPGEPTQAEALGLVFICAGLALWLGVSYLLAGMVAGAIVVNLARHHNRPFHEIEHIEWPFMVLFFVLAGAALKLESLAGIGAIGMAYLVLRTLSRLAGGWLGATWSGAPAIYRRWIGLALMPQAGVALGMGLVAGSHFPDLRETLLALTIATTIIFELIGPLLTQLAIRQIGTPD
jgi:Kef-type K+ transport system membrane component KefB